MSGGDPLLRALEQLGETLPGAARTRAAESMSRHYRDVDRSIPVTAALGSTEDVVAYAVTRMPATYAAAQAALTALAGSRGAAADAGAFEPRTLLDLGGGLGAAAYAAARAWPSIEDVVIIDSQPIVFAAARQLHESLGRNAPRAIWRATWKRQDLVRSGDGELQFDRADLVTIAYVLSEVPAAARQSILDAACAASRSAVVVIEPGTPSGYRRIMDARAAMISAGLEIAAPCPHGLECPLAAGEDWCHFSARLARTRAHRTAKSGRLGYEDEKFSYVAAVRGAAPAGDRRSRIIRHPTWRKSLVELRLCMPEHPHPAVATARVPRSRGALYRAARASSWGDTWPPAESRDS
jgi:ribosomal protein RSM22 (predicted rRNA methylase)